jgi:CHAT domain-containing protein
MALLGTGAAQAQLTPGESAQLDQALQRSVDADVAGDGDACVDLLVQVHPLAQRDWTLSGWRWWGGMLNCWRQRAVRDPALAPGPAAVAAHYRLAQAHFQAVPAGVPRWDQAATRLRWHHRSELRRSDAGLSAAVFAQELEDLRYLTAVAAGAAPGGAADLPAPCGADHADGGAGAHAVPDGLLPEALQVRDPAEAVAELLHIGSLLYGWSDRGVLMHCAHALAAGRLGADHPATLRLLRARIFNERQHGRAAEALQLADAFAAQAARRPGAEAEGLIALNQSERMGALEMLGRYGDALAAGQVVLDWLQQRSPLPQGNLMRIRYNMAGLALAMADADAAERHALAAIGHAEASHDASNNWEARVSRVYLARARLLRGDAGAAVSLQQALDTLSPRDQVAGEPAFALAHHAVTQGDREREAWARDFLQRHLDIWRGSLHSDRALPALLDAAAASPGAAAGRRAALDAVARSLTGRDTLLAALAPFALARHLTPEQPDTALWLYKRGANALQQLRAGLPGEDPGLQRDWLSGHEADLRRFIGLLIDRGRLLEAQQALGVLRDEELHEFSRRSRGAPAPKRPVGPAATSLSYTTTEQARNESLRPLEVRLHAAARAAEERLRNKPRQDPLRESADPQAQSELQEATQQLGNLLERVGHPGGAMQWMPPEAPRQQAATAPEPRLPPDVARLQYIVSADRLDLLVERAGRPVRRIRVPVEQMTLNRAVYALRRAVAAPVGDARPAAQDLYRLIWSPAAAALRGVRQVQVLPDAALRQVPFAALHDGRQWLAEQLTLTLQLGRTEWPQMAARAPLTNRRPQMAAFGRTLPDADHAALPGVADEVAQLQRLGAARGWAVTTTLDAHFTANALRQQLAQRPELVHLASHFIIDPAGEEASYLLLGDGQRLSLSQLRALPWAGVRLALLSACDSAGEVEAAGAGQDGAGRALSGFAQVLRAAGVQQVLASLWRVHDGATARWMAQFYAADASRPRSTAAALPGPARLAQTQRRWLRRHAGTPWAHPHYWAAFTWMGGGPT